MLMRAMQNTDRYTKPGPTNLSILKQPRTFTGPQRQRENS